MLRTKITGNWRYGRRLAPALLAPLLLLALLGQILTSCRPTNTDTTSPSSPTATRAQLLATATTTSPSPTVTASTNEVSQPQPSPTAFTPPDLAYLATTFQARLDAFDGTASYMLIDLQSRQVMAHNEDLALSGMSMVKIPILLETYRVLDEPPTVAQTRLITETATLSGNYTANLLLELIAGRPDPFAGAEIVTKSLRRLGLYNTFIAVPYDEEARSDYLPTYVTPANQERDLTTDPDPSMQTTVRDMATLLQMVYDCSQGQGYLLEVYAAQLTAAECRNILHVLQENDIDAFIEEGVPIDVPVAHKHGWVGDTHGDAGIVFTTQQPYVLVLALHRPGWLEWADSSLVIADLSRLAYAHFTDPGAYSASMLSMTLEELPYQATMPTATPALPQRMIAGTGGAGLTLRDTPAGAEIMVLPEGMVMYLTGADPTSVNGRTWREVQALNGTTGWVVTDFLREP